MIWLHTFFRKPKSVQQHFNSVVASALETGDFDTGQLFIFFIWLNF